MNDISLHGQFPDFASFEAAIDRVMRMRAIARRFGRTLPCHRNMAHAQVTPDLTMPQAMQRLDTNARRAIMPWLTTHGPFWEDARDHSQNDYMESSGTLVTDTAIGEAAFRTTHGVEHHLVSFSPSFWSSSPVPVTWTRDDGDCREIEVQNHWTERSLEAPTPIGSWDDLSGVVTTRYGLLTFSADCFHPLRGRPFVPGAADRIMALLDVLNRLKDCFGADGKRSPEGNRLYQDHFTGDKAWFSDSSDSEKSLYESNLTFRNPHKFGEYLFCTWHGKIKWPQFRIHFSWPMSANEPIFIVYIGPKITV